MEGKKINKVVELGSGYMLAKFDDGEICFLQVITPDGLSEDLAELLEGEPEGKSEKKKDDKPVDDIKVEVAWEELQDMSRKKLEKLADKLDLDVSDFGDDETEALRTALAGELGIEVPVKKEDADTDPASDEYTWDDLKEMDFDELVSLCKENDTDVDHTDYDEDEEDDLRRAIAKEFEIEAPEKKKKKPKKK